VLRASDPRVARAERAEPGQPGCGAQQRPCGPRSASSRADAHGDRRADLAADEPRHQNRRLQHGSQRRGAHTGARRPGPRPALEYSPRPWTHAASAVLSTSAACAVPWEASNAPSDLLCLLVLCPPRRPSWAGRCGDALQRAAGRPAARLRRLASLAREGRPARRTARSS